MKRIVNNTKKEEINLDDFKLNRYNIVIAKSSNHFVLVNVGLDLPSGGESSFKWRSMEDLSFGYNDTTFPTYKKAIESKFYQGCDVFVFDSYHEYLNWSKNS